MKGKTPYLIIAVLGIVLDLGTKRLAFSHLEKHSRVEAVSSDYFQLAWHRVENTGGMFGIGQNHGDWLRYFRLGALGIVLFFFLRADARLKLFMCALSLILAGAVGNLYDSFFNGGAVRDFIQVKLTFMPESWFGKLFNPWPTFNIADAMILVGAVTLVMQLLFDSSGERTAPSAAAKDEDASLGIGGPA